MLKWFRPGPSPFQTALAMIGAKSGDRAVLAGQPDPHLAAELARITGLNGRTLIANQPAAQQNAFEAAAASAGALVEFEDGPAPRFPGEDASADLALLAAQFAQLDATVRLAWFSEALRVLRPGGRIIVIDGAKPAGLFSPKPAPGASSDLVVAWLTDAGGRAARRLAIVDGISYYEARKPR